MEIFIKKSGFRFWVHAFMVLLVLGLFVAACGGNDPLNTASCQSGYTYCSNSGKCCKNGYPYHCDSAGTSSDNTGKCRSTTWTTDLCGSQDKCTG